MIAKDNLVVDGGVDHNKGIWYWGRSGAGKSTLARKTYPNSYKKLANKWWCGYNKQENVLLEDLGKDHWELGYNLKLWADQWHTGVETKGGYIAAVHHWFVVTSQYRPD